MNLNKGATPIEKNIIVIDEQGNEYEATYPKRAKGLVKNGRARFVGENKICLACPPDKILEDNKMADNKTNETVEVTQATVKETKKHTATAVADLSQDANASVSKEAKTPTSQEILHKISELQGQMNNALCCMAQFKEAICAIVGDGEERDTVCYERITEICEVFKARESNYLRILDIYEKMYNETQKR